MRVSEISSCKTWCGFIFFAIIFLLDYIICSQRFSLYVLFQNGMSKKWMFSLLNQYILLQRMIHASYKCFQFLTSIESTSFSCLLFKINNLTKIHINTYYLKVLAYFANFKASSSQQLYSRGLIYYMTSWPCFINFECSPMEITSSSGCGLDHCFLAG
jgi:hypothetical protein